MEQPWFLLFRPSLIVPVVAILSPLVVVVIVMSFVQRHRERRLQLVRELLEKGLPVPPGLLERAPRPGSRLAWALALVGAGVGVSGLLYAMFGTDYGLWAIGLVPLCIGAALLLAVRLEGRDAAGARDPAAPGG
jgi:uncharacterized membrane protein YeaQ/YmgE (transglycosylase-associated protein family)